MSRKQILFSFPVEIIESLHKRADSLNLRYSAVAAGLVQVGLTSMSDVELREATSELPEKAPTGFKAGPHKLTRIQSLMLDTMRQTVNVDQRTISDTRLCRILSVAMPTIRRNLKELEQLGLVKYRGEAPNPDALMGGAGTRVMMENWEPTLETPQHHPFRYKMRFTGAPYVPPAAHTHTPEGFSRPFIDVVVEATTLGLDVMVMEDGQGSPALFPKGAP